VKKEKGEWAGEGKIKKTKQKVGQLLQAHTRRKGKWKRKRKRKEGKLNEHGHRT